MIEVFADNGRVQLTTNGVNYSLAYTFTSTTFDFSSGESSLYVGVGIDGYLNIPIGASDIVAVEVPSGYYVNSIDPIVYRSLYGTTVLPRYVTNLPAGTMVTFFVFKQAKYITNTGTFGVEAYAANGDLTFSTNFVPMKISGILNDSVGSITTTGRRTLIADATSGMNLTVDSAGGLHTSQARVARSGDNYSIQWYTPSYSTVRQGYPANSTLLDLRPSIFLLDFTNIGSGIIPAIPAPPPNAHVADAVSTETVDNPIRITAKSTSTLLRLTGTVWSNFSPVGGSGNTTLTMTWYYRNITLGDVGWTSTGFSHSVSASVSITVEPGAPNRVDHSQSPYAFEDMFSCNFNHVYSFKVVYSYSDSGGYTTKSNSLAISNANDPDIFREINIQPFGDVTKKAASGSYTYTSEIIGGVWSSLNWSLSNISGSGSASLSGQSGNYVTLNISGVAPRGTLNFTMNASALIDSYSRSTSVPMHYYNSSTGVSSVSMPNINLSSANSSSSFTNTVTVSNPYGAALTYVWSVASGSSNYAITSGQGTATITIGVSGVASGQTANGSLSCEVHADGGVDNFYPTCTLSYYNSTGAAVSQISPASQTLSGLAAGRTFASSSISASGTTITYLWEIINSNGGTWTVHTPTASSTTVRVDGTDAATLQCTVVVDGQTYIRTATLSYEQITVD